MAIDGVTHVAKDAGRGVVSRRAREEIERDKRTTFLNTVPIESILV